jgi:hypothetical protein
MTMNNQLGRARRGHDFRNTIPAVVRWTEENHELLTSFLPPEIRKNPLPRIQDTDWTKSFIYYYFFIFLMAWGWDYLVVGHCFRLLYQLQTIDDECGAVGGMRIGRWNRSCWRKPTPVPLFPPQIQYNLTRARTRAATMESRLWIISYKFYVRMRRPPLWSIG